MYRRLLRLRVADPKNGFTLLELVIVISLLTITAVVYNVIAVNLSDVALDAAIKQVASHIRYAQQLAVGSGTNHGIVFQRNGGRYFVYRGSVSELAQDPHTRQSLDKNLQNYRGVSFNSNHQVEFDLWGKPLRGGNQALTLVSDSGRTKELYVIANTGAVEERLLRPGRGGCSCKVCR